MILRKTVVAWYSCAQDALNRPALHCALRIINPQKNLDKNDSDLIFKITSKVSGNEFISFTTFVQIVDSYLSFSNFDGVTDDGTIGYDDMIKEIENQR